MLKTFMQPSTNGATRTDSARANPNYASPRTSEPAKTGEAAKKEVQPDASATVRNDEGSKLIVGPNIKLKGSEITDCEILVVEGRVEASMNSRDIRIAEGGVFSGKAEIDVAEVRGTFEGELTARKRLVVYATGKVSGTIRYGALMVEEGAVITGNIATHAAGPTLAKLPETVTEAPVSAAVEEKAAELEEIRSNSAFRSRRQS